MSDKTLKYFDSTDKQQEGCIWVVRIAHLSWAVENEITQYMTASLCSEVLDSVSTAFYLNVYETKIVVWF